MSTSTYPPVLGFSRLQEAQIYSGASISTRRKRTKYFPETFKSKYGTMRMSYSMYAYLYEKTIPAVKLPVFKHDFLKLVQNLTFVNFAKDVQNYLREAGHNMLDRRDMEAAWVQRVIRGFDWTFDNTVVLASYHQTTRDGMVLNNDADVRLYMSDHFSRGVWQIFSPEAQQFWENVGREYRDLQVSKLTDEEVAAMPDISGLSIDQDEEEDILEEERHMARKRNLKVALEENFGKVEFATHYLNGRDPRDVDLDDFDGFTRDGIALLVDLWDENEDCVCVCDECRYICQCPLKHFIENLTISD